MEALYDYLINASLKKFNLKVLQEKEELILMNNFFVIKLKKRGNKFDMSYFWKLGILHIFFKVQHRKMHEFYSDIKSYAKEKNIVINELHLKYS